MSNFFTSKLGKYGGISRLFFTKSSPTKEIWFYEMKIPEGVTAYNKTNPIKIEDFKNLENWWKKSNKNFSKRELNKQTWKVNLEEIKSNNYNLDFKNPHISEEEIIDPKELLKQYSKIQNDIDSIRGKISKLLSDTLKNSNSNN